MTTMARKISNLGERGYPESFRREVCEAVDEEGGMAAVLAKYKLSYDTVRRWRRDFGLPKLSRHPKKKKKKENGGS